jgi:1,2-diacylglycerol 3-beta-glucosyltransferase
MIRHSRLVWTIVLLSQCWFFISTLYLMALLAAARKYQRRHRFAPDAHDPESVNFAVLIPAHNEEEGIGTTLDSLSRVTYPTDRFEVVVIADNCQDETAYIAASRGATVYERRDVHRRGKGHALAYGLERVLAELSHVDAVAVIDADCVVTQNFLTVLDAKLRSGSRVVQTNNVVSNPDESWASALRFAAFALINTVRPSGKAYLNLSAGLLGTGMCFRRQVLERHPWSAYSLAEDGEYHLRLVSAGERADFASEAAVRSAMPTSLADAHSQQARWEGGRWYLIRRWTPALLRSGLRQRDPVRVHAAIEPLIPPQSLLLACNVISGLMAITLKSRMGTWLFLFSLAGQIIYVLGGLMVIGAPRSVYRALAYAPALVLWKLVLWVRIFLGRSPSHWIRTVRPSSDPDDHNPMIARVIVNRIGVIVTALVCLVWVVACVEVEPENGPPLPTEAPTETPTPPSSPDSPSPGPTPSPAAETPESPVTFDVSPLPLVSRDVPVSASSEIHPASNAVYGDYASPWRGEVPASLVLDLGENHDISDAILVWYSDAFNGDYDFELAGRWAYNLPRDYAVRASSAGDDWDVLEEVTGNVYHSRQHVIDLSGFRYVALEITAVNGTQDNEDVALSLDIHDAGEGIDDNFIFYGDSITAGSMVHRETTFADLVQNLAPDHYPVQQSGGMGGWYSADGTEHIEAWLPLFPGRFVGLAYGTNDAWGGVGPDAYRANLQRMIDAVGTADKIVLLPTIPYSSLEDVAAHVPALNAVVDDLVDANDHVLAGPDFYEFFRSNPDLLSDDGVHPTDEGYAEMRALWAEFVVRVLYNGE